MILCLGLATMASAAQPGDRDVSFGNDDGVVAMDLADTAGVPSRSQVVDSWVLPDGRILVLGRMNRGGKATPPNWRGFVIRHRADGSLDESFGIGGIALLPGAFGTEPYRMIVDDAGRILMSVRWIAIDTSTSFGGSAHRAGLVRLTPSGRIDASWGQGGMVSPPLSNVGEHAVNPMVGLARLPGNRFAINYRISNTSMGVMVVDSTGQPVADFGTGGVQTLDFPSGFSISAYGLMGLSDGKIQLYGSASPNNGSAFFGRLLPSGAWDTAVGGGTGYTTTVIGTESSLVEGALTDAVEIGDGRVAFAAKYRVAGGDFHSTVAMFHANGTLDTTFGSTASGGGRLGYTLAIRRPNTRDMASAISRLGNGDFIVAGGEWDISYVLRLNAIGDTQLWRQTQPGNTSQTARLTPEGDLIALGQDGDTYRLQKRQVNNGALVSGFGSNGLVEGIVSRSEMQSRGLHLATGGALVLAADAQYGISGGSSILSEGYLRRLSANGLTPLATTIISDLDSSLTREAISQVVSDGQDGTIAVLGSSSIRLARILADGSQDLGFGQSGFTPSISSVTHDQRRHLLARQASGRLLVADPAGYIRAYTATGAVDSSFGNNGVLDLRTSFPGFPGFVRSVIALSSSDADGFLVLGGRHLARFQANGDLNTAWSGDGLFSFGTNAVNPSELRSAAMDSEGRIIAVGVNGSNKPIAVRFTPNGNLDTSFDGDGRRAFNWSSRHDRADLVVIDADNKPIIAGIADQRAFPDLFIERLLTTGATDTSFGTNGQIIERRARVADALLTAEGRLLVLASTDGKAVVYAYHTEANDEPIGIITAAGPIVVDENSTTSIPVRLASRPDAPVTVTISLVAGSDPRLSWASSTSLTFTPYTWAIDQTVTLAAARGTGTEDGSGAIRFAGDGLVTIERGIVVNDIDEFSVALIASTSELVIPEGESRSLTVRLSDRPATTQAVSVGLTAITDPEKFEITSPSTLSFTTSNWDTPQTITIRSPNDDDAINDQGGLRLSGSNLTTVVVSLIQADADSGINTPPTISAFDDMNIALGSSIDPIPFTISDAQTSADDLTLSFESTNSALISSENGVSFAGSGESRTLILHRSPGITGTTQITIIVSDGTLTAQSSFFLNVEVVDPAPPEIRRQPESQVVLVGDRAEFWVSVVAYPEASYQWFRAGDPDVAISGATSAELIIDPVSPADEGEYYVVVSNSEGSVTSTVVSVIILSPPVAPTSLVASAVAHNAIHLNWTDPTDPSDLAVQVDGFAIEVAEGIDGPWSLLAEATDVTYTHTGLPQLSTRFYRVRAINAAGHSDWSNVATATTMQQLEEQYLISFGDTAYSSDGVNTWQNFRLRQTAGANSAFLAHTNVELVNSQGVSSGIHISLSSNITGNNVGQNDPAIGGFSGNPFDWFTPSEEAQRITPAFNQNGSSITYTISGFAPTDVVDVAMVIRRDTTGRNIDLVYNPGESDQDTLLNNQDSGISQYVTKTALTGATSYSFRLTSRTNNNWVGTINAMAITVTNLIDPGLVFSDRFQQ